MGLANASLTTLARRRSCGLSFPLLSSQARESFAASRGELGGRGCRWAEGEAAMEQPFTGVSKGEPKVYFANERTFLHWLTHSIYLGSAASGLLGVSQHAQKHWDPQYRLVALWTKGVLLAVLVVSIWMVVYSARMFTRRDRKIVRKEDGPFDDMVGPFVLGAVMLVLLLSVFVSTVVGVTRSLA